MYLLDMLLFMALEAKGKRKKMDPLDLNFT